MKLLLKTILLLSILSSIIYANTFNINDKDYWLKLLNNKEYTLLDTKLQKLYNNIKQDITKERELDIALSSFYNSRLSLEQMLKKWQKEKPNSLFALTAWGIYNTNIAFLSRGGNYINKTTSKQISKMRAYFREAKDSLTYVVEKDSKFTVATKYLLFISMANGSRDTCTKLLNKSLLINPNSYLIRYQYLSLLQPKWGGSLELLNLFMEESASIYDKNKALKRQEGYYEYVLSDVLRLKKGFNKDKQLNYLNEAIKKNKVNGYFYMKRGDAYYYYKHDMQKAIENYTKSLELSPQNSGTLEMLAKVYLKKKDYDKALIFINKSLQYDGLVPSALRIRGEIYFQQNRMNKALASYQDSLIYASENARAYTYIGYIYERKKNYALATEALLKADTIKPGSANDWYVITSSQWHDRDCKFVKSAYIYRDKCKTSKRKCKKKELDWAIKSAKYAKARGICK